MGICCLGTKSTVRWARGNQRHDLLGAGSLCAAISTFQTNVAIETRGEIKELRVRSPHCRRAPQKENSGVASPPPRIAGLHVCPDHHLGQRADGRVQHQSRLSLQFLEVCAWPDGTFATPTAPFVICIVGEDPFGNRLDQAVDLGISSGILDTRTGKILPEQCFRVASPGFA